MQILTQDERTGARQRIVEIALRLSAIDVATPNDDDPSSGPLFDEMMKLDQKVRASGFSSV